MNRKITPVLFLYLLGYLTYTALSWAEGAQTITLKGKPLTLIGEKSKVGKTLPNLRLPDLGLNMVDLRSFHDKVTILSIVPSLDTPTCDKQTHILLSLIHI